jgi:hypothetical protein
LENVEEMNKFLDAFDLPKLNQEDINHLIRSTRSDKIKEVMKSLTKRTQDWTDLPDLQRRTNTNLPQTMP